MYTDSKEIVKMIKEKEGDSGITDLRTRMDEDFFDLYTLEEYDADEGYNSYTSSAPRNFFDKVLDGLNRAELSIQIKLPDDASETDREAAAKGELYLWGALNDIDRTMRNRGEPPLRQQVAFYACARGWISSRLVVHVLEDQTIFDCVAWDPLHVFWERGPKQLLWGAYKRNATKAQIKAEFDIDIKEWLGLKDKKDADITDFWDEESNSILVRQDFAKPPAPHGIGHPPIFIGSVGSMPTIQSKDYDSTMEYRGDSIWAASRNLYEPLNKITSRNMDLYDRSVVGSIIHKSKKGDKSLKGDPYKTYQEIKVSSDDDEEITPLVLPEISQVAGVLNQIINTDIAQSSLPYPLSYGGTRQAMSGAALGILAEGTRSVYNPRTELIEQFYTWLCEELLSQFKLKGQKPADLKGYKGDGEFFKVSVKPKDIDENWFVSVDCSPKMPRDRETEIMMSLAATQQRSPQDVPLISKQTAREDIMELRDPDAEADKVLEEMGMSLPPIQVTQIAKALKERGRPDLAEDVLMLLNPQGAQRQPQIPPNLLQAVVEALGMNEETKPLAEALVKVMTGQGQPSPPQQEVR